jgi:hypothetical protein
MAVWLQISIEGLAFAALAGVVMTVRHTLDGREWPRLGAYLWTLALACLVLPLGLQGWRGAVELHCDSMSPVYFAPLAVLPPLASALHGMFAQNTPMQRASSVALAAGATLAAFLVTGTRCFAGPFDMLDPVVYRFWYLGVVEGLPIWRQDAATALIVILPAAVGSVGSVAAAWRERDRARRADWISLAVLGTGALGLAVLVMRTGFVAHLLAMPGATWLAAAAFRRARAAHGLAAHPGDDRIGDAPVPLRRGAPDVRRVARGGAGPGAGDDRASGRERRRRRTGADPAGHAVCPDRHGARHPAAHASRRRRDRPSSQRARHEGRHRCVSRRAGGCPGHRAAQLGNVPRGRTDGRDRPVPRRGAAWAGGATA